MIFLALHHEESVSLNNSFFLLEHLPHADFNTRNKMLSQKFLNKAIGTITFANPFLKFAADTMILYLNFELDLNLSCAKDFRNPSSMVTWCIC